MQRTVRCPPLSSGRATVLARSSLVLSNENLALVSAVTLLVSERKHQSHPVSVTAATAAATVTETIDSYT